MLHICQSFIFNAAPTEKVEHQNAGRSDPHFLKCHIRAHCVCVCVRLGGQQKYEILPLFGTYFLTTPLYLHTERISLGTEEEIRKLYFDDKI